jgi:hypothetical protein
VPPTLPYATADRARPSWRPILIKPSHRSLLLFTLALAAFLWLTARHAPWTPTAHVWINGHTAFAGKHHFITVNQEAVQLWNAHTGEHVRTIAQNRSGPPGVEYIFADETHLLVAYNQQQIFQISRSDQPQIRALPNPLQSQERVLNAAPSAGRFMTFKEEQRADTLGLYDINNQSKPGWFGAPLRRTSSDIVLSPDGRHILLPSNGPTFVSHFDFDNPQRGKLLDLPQSHGLAQIIARHPKFLITRKFPGIPPGLELRGYDDFRPRHSITLDAPARAVTEAQLAPDARTLAARYSPSPGILRTRFYDAPTNRLLATHDRNWTYINFFPDSQRFVCYDREYHKPAIFRIGAKQPIAVIDNTHDWSAGPIINADGSLLALVDYSAGEATIYRPTGPDCPESPLGALAFPHTWLLILLTSALALSLQSDARKQSLTSSTFHPLSSILVFSLLLLALPRTLHLLLTAATQQKLLLTPGPLLLLAAIGLATNSRFWRFATLTLLALQLPLNLYCLRLLHKSGLTATTPAPILDRVWPIPHLTVLIALALATLAIPFAIYHLSRTPRHNF